jgi:uncharacterized protein
MRIAVVGSGIAGNTAAYALSHTPGIHSLVVYERDLRPGGHSATVDIHHHGKAIAVDTGFIVYNEKNYPLLTRLFDHLGVETQESDMSFGFSLDGGRREWSGQTKGYINAFFAQRRSIASPRHWKMLFEMTRFSKVCRQVIATGEADGLSLAGLLDRFEFGGGFRDDYLIPMGAAIWSTPPADMPRASSPFSTITACSIGTGRSGAPSRVDRGAMSRSSRPRIAVRSASARRWSRCGAPARRCW